MRRLIAGSLLAALLLHSPARAQIERLDLTTMLARCDEGVAGTITAERVLRIEGTLERPVQYYTLLTVTGRSLHHDDLVELEIVFPGGFVSDEEGVYNSEAPAADDVRIGNEVVVFYAWVDDLGHGQGAYVMYAAHGGVYRVVKGPGEPVVLGRGEGYAVSTNVRLADLRQAVRATPRNR